MVWCGAVEQDQERPEVVLGEAPSVPTCLRRQTASPSKCLEVLIWLSVVDPAPGSPDCLVHHAIWNGMSSQYSHALATKTLHLTPRASHVCSADSPWSTACKATPSLSQSCSWAVLLYTSLHMYMCPFRFPGIDVHMNNAMYPMGSDERDWKIATQRFCNFKWAHWILLAAHYVFGASGCACHWRQSSRGDTLSEWRAEMASQLWQWRKVAEGITSWCCSQSQPYPPWSHLFPCCPTSRSPRKTACIFNMSISVTCQEKMRYDFQDVFVVVEAVTTTDPFYSVGIATEASDRKLKRFVIVSAIWIGFRARLMIMLQDTTQALGSSASLTDACTDLKADKYSNSTGSCFCRWDMTPDVWFDKKGWKEEMCCLECWRLDEGSVFAAGCWVVSCSRALPATLLEGEGLGQQAC